MDKRRSEWSLDLERRFGIGHPGTRGKVRGVYAFRMNTTDEVAYVGSTGNLYGRCKSYHTKLRPDEWHLATIWAWEHMGEWWFDVLQVCNELNDKQLQELEADYTRKFEPFLNKQYGKECSKEMAEKIRASNTGKHRTEEQRERYRASKTGSKNPHSRRVLCIETGRVFESAGEAVRWLRDNGYPKASHTPISNCCRGEQKSAYGYHWQYA